MSFSWEVRFKQNHGRSEAVYAQPAGTPML
jgi:hypothetical protein